GQPTQKLRRAGPGSVVEGSRVPPGHPEGYLEGFANLYSEAAAAIRSGQRPDTLPGIEDGLEGLYFIDACVRSNDADAAWVQVRP
ncbi:MAG: gfo/Idh/MocA family oxidoreductase, partial [Paracoccus sp. (in: a-proteobacteria)]|nr:gfo/Idh/MocA family oxidoreductase [Paracoccus sp. (in: a-proteobacteria)]